MGVTLQYLRDSLMDAVHQDYGATAKFGEEKVTRAIKKACNEFLMGTQLARKKADVSFTSGASAINIATTLTDFVAGRQLAIYIPAENDIIAVRSLDDILSMRDENSGATGQPRYLAFAPDETNVEVFPTMDAAYTVIVAYWTGFTTISPLNTKTTTTTNIPDLYADLIMSTGGKWHLLHGLDGFGDLQQCRVDFLALIEEAKGQSTEEGVWIWSMTDDSDNSYQTSSLL